MHMASEGLFPQLIVIPLHRDHGVITMAAGKNDVIKLLPPLTLSEAEARSVPRRARRRAHRLRERRRARTGRWCATSPPRRCAGVTAAAPGCRWKRRSAGSRIDRSRDDVCLVTGATRIHRRSPGRASGARGLPGALPRAPEQRHRRCSTASTSSSPSATSTSAALAGPRRRGLPLRLPLRRDGLRLGHDEGDRRASTSRARGSCSSASADASVRRVVHFARTDVYGYPGGVEIDETYAATGFRNWYAQTKLAAEAEVRAVRAAHGLDTVILRPATVYGPRSEEVVGEIARAIRSRQHAADRQRPGGRGPLLRRQPRRRRRCSPCVTTARAGQAFNVTRRARRHLAGARRRTSRTASAARRSRWSLPYRLASGVGFSLEHGYRALRRTTRPEDPAAALAPGGARDGHGPELQQP